MILFCIGCLFGCKTKDKKEEKEIILHAGAGAWEMEYIWEGAWEIPGEERIGRPEPNRSGQRLSASGYFYDSLTPEEYLRQEPAFGPEILIANSRLGYKISLKTGESYQMRSGDRLFLKKSSDVEIYAEGLQVERKSFDSGPDICEVYREYGSRLFRMMEQGRELLFYQCSRQKGKLYITYF